MTRAVRTLANRTFPVIFAAPSGAGKTAIAEELLRRRGDLVFSVSATTRPKRSYERDGEHYRFLTESKFRAEVAAGGFLEWAEVHGHLYGTPRDNLDRALTTGQYLVLDIDIQGARQVRREVPEAISVFVLPPTGRELVRRLAGRGSEDLVVQRRRLRNARQELEAATEFDYVLVNDSLETSVEQVDRILRAEASRVSRIPDLPAELAAIRTEIDSELARDLGQPQSTERSES